MGKNASVRLPARLSDAVGKGRCVLLVGSGISKQSDRKHFPNWSELLLRMAAAGLSDRYLHRADVESIERLVARGQHLMAGEFLKNTLPRDYYISFLEQQFAPEHVVPSKLHKLLFRLKAKFILTTNYDKLIEDAYASLENKSITVHLYNDPAAIQRKLQDGFGTQRPFLFKLHGDIDDPSQVILTEQDYRRLAFDEKGYLAVLSSIFINYVVLMIGFSLHDPELLNLLGQLRHALKSQSNPDYALIPSGSADKLQLERFRADFGLEVITYAARNNHVQLYDTLQELAKSAEGVK